MTASSERIADLNLAVESEKLARAKIEGDNALREIEILKLRRALADRILSPEEHAAISQAMLAFPGTVFRVTSDHETNEETGFGRWIASALVNAKWSEERTFIDARILRPLVGISIQATDGIPSQTAAKALAGDLLKMGHAVEFDSSRADGWLWHSPSSVNGSHERIWIRIGTKPNPPVVD